MADASLTRINYITTTGPDSIRYGQNRKINLLSFLPSSYREGDVNQFVLFFEDFLNEMFDGYDGLKITQESLSTTQEYTISSTSAVIRNEVYSLNSSAISGDTNDVIKEDHNLYSNDTKYSILEKIYRITELHNPDLIDIDYIQFFAENLGYKLDVYRNEAGGFGTDLGIDYETTSATSASDINRYLRFMCSNLPSWYKIKSTDNAIQVMLNSFGLVGELINYWTSNYEQSTISGSWIADYNGNLSGIPNTYYATPHFALKILMDESDDLITDVTRRNSVIRAIESIRPINTVFRRLSGYVLRLFTLEITCNVRLTRYIRIS